MKRYELTSSAINDGGVVALGAGLFNGEPIESYLSAWSEGQRWKSVRRALLQPGKLTRIRVKRALTEGLIFRDGIVLSQEAELRLEHRRNGVMARAIIPFTGDRSLFRCAYDVTSSRTLRAHMQDHRIILTARARADDAVMLPAVILSEAAAIEAQLARQAVAIAEHNRVQLRGIRTYIDDQWNRIRFMQAPTRRQESDDLIRLRTEMLRRVKVLEGNDAVIFREIKQHGLIDGLSRWRPDDTPASWLARVRPQ